MTKTIRRLLRKYFITGILVTLPLGLTYWILKILLPPVEQLIGYPIRHYLKIYFPGMGILLLACLILLIGIFASNFFGRKLGQIGERILDKIPFVRIIYKFVKQLVDTLFTQGQARFKGVVFVEYPRKGIYSIGFLTSECRGEIREITDEKLVNVFIPTTPNPTSGFFLIFPEKDVKILDMTVEEGLKMIISAGMITPAERCSLPGAQGKEPA
ncbi:MAG: DUF502 domain-containing protein [Deltaproteobacteria bacterium]|nr:DUF502 domain-containing protein [Deltaproteobacteria bacterium]